MPFMLVYNRVTQVFERALKVYTYIPYIYV